MSMTPENEILRLQAEAWQRGFQACYEAKQLSNNPYRNQYKDAA